MYRDWSIATQKSTNAIVEGLAFEVIRKFYERQGIKMNQIDYNSALDLTGKQKYDLRDGYGKTWEIKCDKRWKDTGNVFFEHLAHADFDYMIMFAFRPYILTKHQYLDLIHDPRYAVKSSREAFNAGSLVPLIDLHSFAYDI